jgi:uncharacterized protein (DUF885 family)
MRRMFALTDALLRDIASLRPSAATFWGINGYDHAWDDFGPRGAAAAISAFEHHKLQIDNAPRANARDELAALFARDFIDVELERLREGDHLVDLNNIASPFQNIRMVFDVMNTSTREGWQNIAERLATIDRALETYKEALEEGRRSGRTAAVRQVDAAIEQGRVHAGESSSFRTLATTFASSSVFDAALASRLDDAIAHAQRAYADLTDYLEQTYRPAATPTDGFGEERYARKARAFLGMSIDLRETFAWGWDEIRRLSARMENVAAQINPSASLDEVITLLERDPSRCAHSPRELVRFVAERQARAVEELSGTHFDIPAPVRNVDVKLAPPGSTLGAYYVPPSPDFSRPGSIWYSPGNNPLIPLYSEVSTAYHEGFPGHHLQLGVQVSLSDELSLLHRVMITDFQTGYAEGWALYAERLMEELGYLEKPEYVLGMLACQMMRACRVVLDIGAHLGLHAPKDAPHRPGAPIDFDYGVGMLVRLGRMNEAHARSEMTRYLGWPGQAIAYKVGERVMLGLRDEVRARQGSSFDLKKFHASILSTGAIGLGALRKLVLA